MSLTIDAWIARATAPNKDARERARCLDEAETLASGVDDWLRLAEVSAGLEGEGSARARAALDRARRQARRDEGGLQRVASGYALWLGDHEAARRLAPHGVRPGALRPGARARLLEGFSVGGARGQAATQARDADAARLFDWLRSRLTPAQRDAIASDDPFDAPAHRAALDVLCSAGRAPLTLTWAPGEAARLGRWRRGEGVDHAARGLCLALLCLYPDGDEELEINAPRLVESSLALGEQAALLAERLLVWCYEAAAAWRPQALLSALLGIAALVATRDPDDPRLERVAGLAEALAYHELIALMGDPATPGEVAPEAVALLRTPGEVAPGVAALLRAPRGRLWEQLATRCWTTRRDSSPALARLAALFGL